jgi:hypothetical protein
MAKQPYPGMTYGTIFYAELHSALINVVIIESAMTRLSHVPTTTIKTCDFNQSFWWYLDIEWSVDLNYQKIIQESCFIKII